VGPRHNGNPLVSCEEDNPRGVDETPPVGRVNTSSSVSHEEKENLPQWVIHLQRLPRCSESPLNFPASSFSPINYTSRKR